MIRKLASGQFRLYSRKTDPKTGKRKTWGPSRAARPPEAHEARGAVFQAALKAGQPRAMAAKRLDVRRC